MGARFIEGLLKNTTKNIENEGFIARNRMTPEAFTRNRKLTFKNLLLVLMSLTRPSVQTELDRFFKTISKNPGSFESVSKSAFTQSRKHLNPEVFIDLLKSQLSYFDEHAPFKKSWKGKRVVGIDGSLLNLPHCEEIKNEFGSVKNQHEEVVSSRCSFAYDVCNNLVLDAEIAPRKSCEKELAAKHIDHLTPTSDILVFDRGYPCQWLVGLLMKQNFKFCFRLSTAWKKATALMEGDCNDMDWTMNHNTHKCSDHMKNYNIPKQLKGLRLIAILLPSGEKEILLTNLTDRENYSITDLKELYHLRWGVEEGFKSFKKTLHVEHFTGRTSLSVKQDFHAKVLMLNMASMIASQGLENTINKKEKTCKHKSKPNRTQVLGKTKDFMIDLFYNKRIREYLRQMLKLLEGRLDVVRPERAFKRSDASSRRRCKIMISKGI